MYKTKPIFEFTLVAMSLLCFSAGARAQDQPQGTEAGRISETLRAVSYPEVIYGGGFVPDWDHGYVIHHEIEINSSPDAPMVVMYDASGKRVREGRIWPLGAGSVRIRRTAATRDGAILAVGWAVMQDGSIQHYIAKTDLAGRTVQSLRTGSFASEQICEAPDGTIWSLGQAVGSEGGPQHDTNILRHYSFEKGLLHGFLPEDTVRAVLRSNRPWFNPFESFVRCGKDKISVYLNFTDEYAEVSSSSFELTRWKLDEAAVQQGKASGLAVTEDGRVYASFSANGGSGPVGLTGLYQVEAQPGMPIARLLPVAGAVSVFDGSKPKPAGAFVRLWGADGNQLVVKLSNNWDICWVNVIHADGTD